MPRDLHDVDFCGVGFDGAQLDAHEIELIAAFVEIDDGSAGVVERGAVRVTAADPS